MPVTGNQLVRSGHLICLVGPRLALPPASCAARYEVASPCIALSGAGAELA